MKAILTILVATCLLASCSNGTTTSTSTVDSTNKAMVDTTKKMVDTTKVSVDPKIL